MPASSSATNQSCCRRQDLLFPSLVPQTGSRRRRPISRSIYRILADFLLSVLSVRHRHQEGRWREREESNSENKREFPSFLPSTSLLNMIMREGERFLGSIPSSSSSSSSSYPGFFLSLYSSTSLRSQYLHVTYCLLACMLVNRVLKTGLENGEEAVQEVQRKKTFMEECSAEFRT